MRYEATVHLELSPVRTYLRHVTAADDNTQRGDFDAAFGARMRRARQRAGVSQGDLVANLLLMHEVHWHQTTVARTEAGERPVRLSEAVAVADLLNVPLGELAYEPADDTTRIERVALAYAELARVRQGIDRQLSRLHHEMSPSTNEREDG